MEVAAPELSEPTGVKSTTEDIIRDKKRKIVGMSLIERLELKYGGQGLGIMTDSDEESSEMDSEDEPSSAEESGEGGGGGDDDGAEGGAAGDSGAKKVAKKKRRVADELDYEDDFIDDAELEKVFYAKVYTVAKKCGREARSPPSLPVCSAPVKLPSPHLVVHTSCLSTVPVTQGCDAPRSSCLV